MNRWLALFFVFSIGNALFAMEFLWPASHNKYPKINPFLGAIDTNNVKKIKKYTRVKRSWIEQACKYAAQVQKWDIVEYFLEQGCDPNTDESVGFNLYYYAVKQENDAAITLLLTWKVPVTSDALNWVIDSNINPFTEQHLARIKRLIPHIDNVNQSNSGRTCLHEILDKTPAEPVALSFRKKMINFLLFHGANPYIKNFLGKTAIETAQEQDLELAQHMSDARHNLVLLLTNLLGKTVLPCEIAKYIAELRYPDYQKAQQIMDVSD